MYRFIVFSIFLLAYSPLVSQSTIQTPEVTIGKSAEMKVTNSFSSILGQKNSSIFVQSWKSGKHTVSEYNVKTLTPTGKSLTYAQKESAWVLNTLYFNDRIVVITKTTTKRKGKKNRLYIQTADPKTLTFDSERKEILTRDFIQKFGQLSLTHYQFKLSEDQSKLLIYYHQDDQGQDAQIGVCIVDENLEVLYDRHHKLNIPTELLDLQDAIIENNGNAYIVAKDKQVELSKSKEARAYLLKFQPDTASVIERIITPKGKYLGKIRIVLDQNEVVLMGTHTAANTNNLLGTYYQSFKNNNLDANKPLYQNLALNDLLEVVHLESRKKATKAFEKGKASLYFDYRLDHLEKRNDGGFYLIGERIYNRESYSTNPSNGRTTSTGVNIYANVIVVSLSEKGEVLWVKSIPKLQRNYSSYLDWVSYHHYLRDDSLYFYYNDIPKNQTILSGAPFINDADATNNVMCAIVSHEGLLTKQAIVSSMQFFLQPDVLIHPSADEVIFIQKAKKRYNMVKLTYSK